MVSIIPYNIVNNKIKDDLKLKTVAWNELNLSDAVLVRIISSSVYVQDVHAVAIVEAKTEKTIRFKVLYDSYSGRSMDTSSVTRSASFKSLTFQKVSIEFLNLLASNSVQNYLSRLDNINVKEKNRFQQLCQSLQATGSELLKTIGSQILLNDLYEKVQEISR